MKLQELLRKCDFDKMFEYIVKFDSDMEGFEIIHPNKGTATLCVICGKRVVYGHK